MRWERAGRVKGRRGGPTAGKAAPEPATPKSDRPPTPASGRPGTAPIPGQLNIDEAIWVAERDGYGGARDLDGGDLDGGRRP